MGTTRLFWPQEMMDEWVVDEKAVIEDGVLDLVAEGTKYRIAQAVHFVTDVGDGTDPHGLVGRVKEVSVLEEMGAEHYMDSVLVEDSAYQVVPGFSGVSIVRRATGAGKGMDITGAIATQAGDGEPEDRELLAKFLLDNL